MVRPSKDLLEKAMKVHRSLPRLMNGKLTLKDHKLLSELSPVSCLEIFVQEIQGLNEIIEGLCDMTGKLTTRLKEALEK